MGCWRLLAAAARLPHTASNPPRMYAATSLDAHTELHTLTASLQAREWTAWWSRHTAFLLLSRQAPRGLTRGAAPAGAGARRGAGGRGRRLILRAEGARGRGPRGAAGAPARAGLAARRARRRRALRRHRCRCGAGREGSVCVVSGCAEQLPLHALAAVYCYVGMGR